MKIVICGAGAVSCACDAPAASAMAMANVAAVFRIMVTSLF